MKKDFCFSLDGKDGHSLFFAVYSQKDLDEWVAALEKNASLDETEAPERSVDAKKKEGPFSRTSPRSVLPARR